MRTPAELADASIGNIMARDRAGWIGIFAENASVYDPVGPSPHDPEGKGFHGKKEIARLWDTTLGTFRTIKFVVHERYVGGNQAATLFTVKFLPAHGDEVTIRGMAVYTGNGAGEMLEMRSYLIPAGTQFPG